MAAAGKLSAATSGSESDTMRRLSSNSEERSRLTAALSCLKSAEETGGDFRADADAGDVFSPTASQPAVPRGASVSISVVPCSHERAASEPNSPPDGRAARPSRTSPPPPPRRLLQLFPNITLPRSKSHESQLGNRIEETPPNRTCKRNRVLAAIHINGGGTSPEDPALRSPLTTARTPGPVPASAPYTMLAPPVLLDSLNVHRNSPQGQRRDIGLAVTHRFSTKSWLSQTCQVCHRSMMFGVKCKHCKLKCHNKCTKDAPSCRISFQTLPRMRRAESVPSDINNRIDHTVEIPLQYGTLPKAVYRREAPPTFIQPDSSSNPSSAASSAPSSPARVLQSDPPPSVSASPPPNPSPRRGSASADQNGFHFPDVAAAADAADADAADAAQPSDCCDSGASPVTQADSQLPAPQQREQGAAEGPDAPPPAEQRGGKEDDPPGEGDGDGLDELPSTVSWRGRRRGRICREASQTSVYLQEWDIPYEQLQLDELIGQGRWGKVHRGRWHGEVAIRLLEIDGNNADHLKLFKKEVMNYRQTRHENVVLFMGACMAPPHLAIITSFCTGLTLFSMVRERGHLLDLNKTRQIAQEIVKGMGYLHAKGIIHKDLKSKNVFYDTNKVVITDFGLFGMSGVVQEGRRKNVLRIPQGWINYLAPEIVRKMSPEVDEDQLPFSKAADIYAFGTIWYELQMGDWPITDQPVEVQVWLGGSGQGMKEVLTDANLGKEVTEILSSCWSLEVDDRPPFTQMSEMLEKLPKLNRRLSHPGHFSKTNESWNHHHHHQYMYN